MVAYRENSPPFFLPVQILNFVTRPRLPKSHISLLVKRFLE